MRIDEIALRQARDKLQGNALFKNPAILDTLAWSDYRLGDFEKAKGLLILGKADQTSNPQMRFHDGAVLGALGEPTKGQQIIKGTFDDGYPGDTELGAFFPSRLDGAFFGQSPGEASGLQRPSWL